jgi:acylphosphatase
MISGTVQGVGFRWFTEQQLSALGLTGYVRNLPDHRVEAVIEGRVERVDQALVILAKGPPGASVTNVELEDLPQQGLPGFEIRR